MSKKTHTHIITRGVPGTHDVKLLNQTIKKFSQKNLKMSSINGENLTSQKMIDFKKQMAKIKKYTRHRLVLKVGVLAQLHTKNIEFF